MRSRRSATFNYEQIYMRPASVAQSEVVVRVLRALVEFFADRPNVAAGPRARRATGHPTEGAPAGSDQALRDAVTYVAGMTDRFAFAQARAHLGWDPGGLPAGSRHRPVSRNPSRRAGRVRAVP